MQEAAISPHDSLLIAALAAVIAIGLTLMTPTAGMQAVVGFLIVLIAFTSVSAALYLLIASMLLSPELAIGRIEGRGVGGRELSFRMDDILLVVIGVSWFVKNIVYRELALFRDTPLNRPIAVYMVVCVTSTLVGVLNGHVKPMTGFFFVLKYFEYFFVFFMVVNHVRSQQQVVRLVVALLTVGLIVSLYAISQIPSGQRASAPFEGEIGEPNTLGGYLVFLLAIMTGLLLHVQFNPIRIADARGYCPFGLDGHLIAFFLPGGRRAFDDGRGYPVETSAGRHRPARHRHADSAPCSGERPTACQ
jgi:hypothetical protein